MSIQSQAGASRSKKRSADKRQAHQHERNSMTRANRFVSSVTAFSIAAIRPSLEHAGGHRPMMLFFNMMEEWY